MKGLLEQIEESSKEQTYDMLTRERLEAFMKDFIETSPKPIPTSKTVRIFSAGAIPNWKRKLIAKSELKPYDMLDEDYYDMLEEKSDNFTKEKKLTRQEKTWLQYYHDKLDKNAGT
jgi:hypothetical protein